MKHTGTFKPITKFRSHASEIIRKIAEDGQSVVITRRGHAKAILISMDEWNWMQQQIEQARARLSK